MKGPSNDVCFRQYYNLWLSLLGGVMCTAIMFLIQWWTGLLTVAIIIILYLVVAHRKPGQSHVSFSTTV